jgi:hypothetical protein
MIIKAIIPLAIYSENNIFSGDVIFTQISIEILQFISASVLLHDVRTISRLPILKVHY